MTKIFILFLLTLSIVSGSHAQKGKKGTPVNNTASDVKPFNINTFFKPVKWRSIGPFRGGRSVSAAGVIGDISTYYMGTTGGGVWKTQDIGNTWTNISDGYFTTGSVGAIAVAESDPNIVFVGMGEHAPRGVMTHHGDGVYKSTDAGKTWKKCGLELTQHISRIIIHPKNPDIVYVAAQGALYSKSAERGIFKSNDGGTTWSKVLYVDENTGCSELSMDMNNPRILYAAMWEHGRLPWKVISGGPGSGLYKSVDGGDTWEIMKDGLPTEMGKMAISVCRSNPEKVYALIEGDSETNNKGLYVSENAGKSWSQVSTDHRLVQRAWYYIELFTDPKNEHLIYVLSAPALKSIDGGKSWEYIEGPHGDYHDLWINPENPKNLAIADDGGVSISLNAGKTWSTQSNMPTAQLYRINVDNQFPYRIYAGQQDNTSVVISSRELGGSGITRESWTASAGGECAFLAFDPDDPRYVMGGSYLGTIELLDTKAKAGTNIMAAPIQYLARDASEMKFRFNWNAPIIWSKHEPGTFYHGAQLLLKTSDMGKSWIEVSPDLTRNEKEKQGKGGGPYTNEAVGAENYGTISYIMESPHEKGIIYVASDDGLLHLTKDGCKTWQNITPTGLKECLINAIEVSPHDPATAFIATTRYKFNDHTPALYKTTDFGKTWTNISKGIPQGAFTRVVREDDVRKDLLFAGTETGVYISFNGGKEWSPFQLNLPLTPITDLKVHQGNLIAATSGRSFWILDDLTLIRQFNNDLSTTTIFQPGEVILANGSSELNSSSPDFNGTHPYRGVNPANGAVIYYFLNDVKEGEQMTMEFLDKNQNIIRTFASIADSTFLQYDGGPSAEPLISKNAGLNRFVWNLRHATMPGIDGAYIEASYNGHKVPPGKYTARLVIGDKSYQTEFEVKSNPLYNTDLKSFMEYNDVMTKMESELKEMHKLVNSLNKQRTQIEDLLKSLPDEINLKDIKTKGATLIRELKIWDEDMVQRKSKAYDDVENFPNKFTANYMFLINQTESDIPRVNKSSFDRLKELEKEWSELKKKAIQFTSVKIPAFNNILWEAGVGAVWIK
ncbi:MAG: glycosyl hydrolase [Saprospiraceae bacterium]|nr:glycosyl hydrolase [Saprospiraceae bacterium]